MKCSPLIIAMIICASVVVNSYDLNETVLCATTSMPDIAHCNDTFIQEIKDSQNQIRDYCCACNDLKDCIVEHVGDKCGDTEIRQLADHYVKTAIRIGYPWGYCDAYRGFGGIVLCQQDWLLIAEAISLGVVFLGIVFLMIVSVVIRCYRGSRDG